MDLFDQSLPMSPKAGSPSIPGEMSEPLAKRMRPRTLDEFVGQEHLLGEGKLLRRLIESDRVVSLILYGPPGTGKTSLCSIIAHKTQSKVERINATLAGVDDIRSVVKRARERREKMGLRTLLFVDEIHHFNKTQQDAFLPYVEEGLLIMIGATIHNPFFYINPALLSRSHIFELKTLTRTNLLSLIRRALQNTDQGLGRLSIRMDQRVQDYLVKKAEGDARRLLNAIEIGAITTAPEKDGTIEFTIDVAEESLQKKRTLYDRDEDQHYDTISAFIKSVRGSDPDASIYWLAKMLAGGEDPRFIARRLIILASEDVGNADPQALLLATSAYSAVEMIGMPEARIILAHVTTYLASAPKSNAAMMALESATRDLDNEPVQPIPEHLRDAHYKGAEKLGHGKGYQYPHNAEAGWVDQVYMPIERIYYQPKEIGKEADIKLRLDQLRSSRGRGGKT